jgi:hypothetical protein
MLVPAFLAALDHVYAQAVQTLDVTYAEPLERAYKLVYAERVTPDEGGPRTWAVTGSSDRCYLVTHQDGWGCTCPDHVYRRHPCYHILAVQLFCRAMRHDSEASRIALETHTTDKEPTTEKNASMETSGELKANFSPTEGQNGHIASERLPDLLKPFTVLIQGKPFVKVAGLLALAHERGLQSLTTMFTYNDAELALAQSTAVFPFGSFTDVGDASPSSVNPKVRLHFRRVAATRSTARALRQALNIPCVALEELMEEA